MTPIPPFVPQAAPVNTVRNQLVVQTYVVQQARDAGIYYEIYLAPDLASDAPRTALVTKDETAYAFALSLEGKDARVTATFHHARRGSHRFRVLDTLEVGKP